MLLNKKKYSSGEKKAKSKFRKIWNVFSTIILILVVGLVIFIFVTRITGHIPSLFGFTFYRVQTDSMTPTLEPGDVIVDKKVPAEEIKKGDIVTYNCLSGTMAGKTITHRVVTDPENRNGVYWYQTQGDREGAPLDDMITYDQIEGKFISNVKWMNALYSFFLSPFGLISFVLLIVVLFGYEIVSLLISFRKFDKTFETYTDSSLSDEISPKALDDNSNKELKEKSVEEKDNIE